MRGFGSELNATGNVPRRAGDRMPGLAQPAVRSVSDRSPAPTSVQIGVRWRDRTTFWSRKCKWGGDHTWPRRRVGPSGGGLARVHRGRAELRSLPLRRWWLPPNQFRRQWPLRSPPLRPALRPIRISPWAPLCRAFPHGSSLVVHSEWLRSGRRRPRVFGCSTQTQPTRRSCGAN